MSGRFDDTVAVVTGAGRGIGRGLAITADVSRPEDTAGLVAQGVARFGRIDALVTCAAAPPAVGPSETLPLTTWHGVIDVGPTGTFLTCQAVGRHMLAHGRGGIVNVVSMHALATYPVRAAYAAAKAGVAGLTRALAVESAVRSVVGERGRARAERITETLGRVGHRLTEAEGDRRWAEVATLLAEEIVPALRAPQS